MDTGAWFVVRTHSHTDKQCLWKVLTRGIKNEDDALSWLKFMKYADNKPKHKYFLVWMPDKLSPYTEKTDG